MTTEKWIPNKQIKPWIPPTRKATITVVKRGFDKIEKVDQTQEQCCNNINIARPKEWDESDKVILYNRRYRYGN